MSSVLYDSIGKGYAIGRKQDPDIASNIFRFLSGAESILNIGAGAGSYEPQDQNVFAVEPSLEMIAQRPSDAAPVKQAFAESLPFDDKAFSHSMTILSMHHWQDREAAFREIKRVTKTRFVAVTWNPSSEPFWLTHDYFPEIYAIDTLIFPSLSELSNHLPGVKFYPLAIPANCIDGFMAAYWARPQAYLDDQVRLNISTFSKIDKVALGLQKLSSDLKTGRWDLKYAEIQSYKELDVGYVVAVWDV